MITDEMLEEIRGTVNAILDRNGLKTASMIVMIFDEENQEAAHISTVNPIYFFDSIDIIVKSAKAHPEERKLVPNN
jgi:hypothetical protein